MLVGRETPSHKGTSHSKRQLSHLSAVKICPLSTYFLPNFRLMQVKGNIATWDDRGGVGGELISFI